MSQSDFLFSSSIFHLYSNWGRFDYFNYVRQFFHIQVDKLWLVTFKRICNEICGPIIGRFNCFLHEIVSGFILPPQLVIVIVCICSSAESSTICLFYYQKLICVWYKIHTRDMCANNTSSPGGCLCKSFNRKMRVCVSFTCYWVNEVWGKHERFGSIRCWR